MAGRRIIIDTDDNGNVDALINYIRSLDYVKKIEEDECKLSDEQKKAIDHALDQCDKGMTIPHEEVMKQTKEKYPHLFK